MFGFMAIAWNVYDFIRTNKFSFNVSGYLGMQDKLL